MSKHILILGGGVIGLSIAYYAQQKGHKVTVVERGAPNHDMCSLGNAGMIVPSHFVPLAAPGMISFGLKSMLNPESPFYMRPRLSPELLSWGTRFMAAANAGHVERVAPFLRDLNLRSRECYVELAETFGNNFGLVEKGLLMLCKTSHALAEEAHMAERANALGVPAQVLTPEETATLDSAIDMDIAGAVYFPKDCHLSPGRFVGALTSHLLGHGAEFAWNTEVTGWREASGAINGAQTSNGVLEADEYVIAGGAWSSRIAHGLRATLPMQAGKGYSLTLPTPKQLPALCSILVEARVAVTPMLGALRFGGTMEITGLDESINPRRVNGIVKSATHYFPKFTAGDFAGVTPWRGLRPLSPDGVPYIGRLESYKNLSVATGHAMMGLSLGPITGKLMAQVLSDEPTSMAISKASPDRFN